MIHFVLGSPGSGKTTFAKEWKRTHPNFTIVSGDDIRLALHGKPFDIEREWEVSHIKQVMIRALYNRGHDLLLDGTHTTEASISKIFKVDPLAGYTFLDTPYETCLKNRPYIAIEVMEHFKKNLEILKDGGLAYNIERIREKCCQ